MIYTSYFGKIKAITAVDPSAVFIAVCGGLPNWWQAGQNFKWLRKVAPRRAWWSEWHERFKDDYESDESKRWYIEKYEITVLDRSDPMSVLAEIQNMSEGSNVYLLCYETPEKFCHRRLLAEWLNSKTGAGIKEWKSEDENQK